MLIIQTTTTRANLPTINYPHEKSRGSVLGSLFKIGCIGASFAAIGYLFKTFYDQELSPTLSNRDASNSLTLKLYNKYADGCDSLFHKCQTTFFNVFESTSNGVSGSVRAYIADGNLKAFKCEYNNRLSNNRHITNDAARGNMIRELLEKASRNNTLDFLNLIARDGFHSQFTYQNRFGESKKYNCLKHAALELVNYDIVKALLHYNVHPEVLIARKETLLNRAISINKKLQGKGFIDQRIMDIIKLIVYFGADVNNCLGRYGSSVSCFKHLDCKSLSESVVSLLNQKGAAGEPCKDISLYFETASIISIFGNQLSRLSSAVTSGFGHVKSTLKSIRYSGFFDWLDFDKDFFSRFFEKFKNSDGSYEYKRKSNNNKSEQNHFQYDGKMSYTRALRVLRLSDKPSNTKELKRFCRKRLRDAHPDKMMHTHPKMSLEEASERFIEMTAACEYFKESLFS